MRDLKRGKEVQAKFRAIAKAAKAGTMRAKVLKRIVNLEQMYAEMESVQRYYCTQFRFWLFCRFAPCRRARACKGDADACLKRSVDQLPREEIWQTREKLLEATPRHFGAVERKVRQTWPTQFWPRPVDRELVRALAEARRQRQLDKEWFARIQPCAVGAKSKTTKRKWNAEKRTIISPRLRARHRSQSGRAGLWANHPALARGRYLLFRLQAVFLGPGSDGCYPSFPVPVQGYNPRRP